MDRRTFLVAGSATILGATSFRASEAAVGTGSLSARLTTGGPLVTPASESFVYSSMRTPRDLPRNIDVDGLVDKPVRYDLDEMRHMPQVRQLRTLECYVNTAGGPLIYTNWFTGVPLAALLHRAGLKPEANAARFETTDGHAPFLLPLSELRRPGAVLMAAMGPDPMSGEHGPPYTRLFVPGTGGNHNPKWVSRITLVEKIAPEHPAPVQAGFLSPPPPEAMGSLSGIRLTGYAFAGPERVGRVELSTDEGATYQPMPLPEQSDPYVWVTWNVFWRPPRRGFYVLRVRSWSASGRKQDTPGVIAVEVH